MTAGSCVCLAVSQQCRCQYLEILILLSCCRFCDPKLSRTGTGAVPVHQGGDLAAAASCVPRQVIVRLGASHVYVRPIKMRLDVNVLQAFSLGLVFKNQVRLSRRLVAQ